jgi:hypothetical protein
MQNQEAQQVVKVLKEANNVMVTVKNSPSVDELTAAIALTLILNHLNKHATTVFSGVVPSTIEFLQPEMAIESNTDSLRDFIISLDKSKADKLRYKVEDNVVRIFITPYRTSISQNDLEFTQGDFNVDVVVALGVVGKEDFDQAVTSHGRILHDATIVSVTKQEPVSQIGAINWHDPQASSVSEMISSVTEELGENVLDGQIATALLTGIVAETDRFKNAKTTPKVLALSSKLMSSGANQQLIAEKLEANESSAPPPPVVPLYDDKESNSNGTLEIGHFENKEDEIQKIHIDDHGNLDIPPKEPTPKEPAVPLVNSVADIPETQTVHKREVSAHEYIPNSEAKITQPSAFEEDDSVSGGLFSNQTKQDVEPSLDSTAANAKTFEHTQRTIEPLVKDQSELSENQSSTTPYMSPASTSVETNQIISSDADTTAPDPVVSAPPVKDRQTLTDLENLVESETRKNESGNINLDDFTGSVRKPVAKEPENTKTEENKIADLIAAKVKIKKEEKETSKSTTNTEVPPPKEITPTSAPAVPPPIIPQVPSQPEFYEADGSKNNSFLNPTED